MYHDSPAAVQYTASVYCDTLQNMTAEMIELVKNHRDKIRQD